MLYFLTQRNYPLGWILWKWAGRALWGWHLLAGTILLLPWPGQLLCLSCQERVMLISSSVSLKGGLISDSALITSCFLLDECPMDLASCGIWMDTQGQTQQLCPERIFGRIFFLQVRAWHGIDFLNSVIYQYPFKYLLHPMPAGQFPHQPVVPRCCLWSYLGHLSIRALCTIFYSADGRKYGFRKIPSEALRGKERGCPVGVSASLCHCKCLRKKKILVLWGCVKAHCAISAHI